MCFLKARKGLIRSYGDAATQGAILGLIGGILGIILLILEVSLVGEFIESIFHFLNISFPIAGLTYLLILLMFVFSMISGLIIGGIGGLIGYIFGSA